MHPAGTQHTRVDTTNLLFREAQDTGVVQTLGHCIDELRPWTILEGNERSDAPLWLGVLRIGPEEQRRREATRENQ
jgi:hypothetical protein